MKLIRSNTLLKMMRLESVIPMLAIPLIFFYREEIVYLQSFLLSSLTAFLFTFALSLLPLGERNGSQTVVLSWIFGIIICALPFVFSGEASILPAIFESVSGLTTTGLSTLNVEKLPKTFLFYRALLQYIGGLGFVMTMLLFQKPREGAVLYSEEGHSFRLMPNIAKSTRVIALIYLLFLYIGTVLYMIFGMNALDAVVHAMCALSTGGFSNRMDSIGAYWSLPIEIVTILLMTIGTTNFALLLLLLKGKIRAFIHSTEFRTFIFLVVIGVTLFIFSTVHSGWSFLSSLRHGLFNVVSALSTSGFSTVPINSLPESSIFILIIMMLIGGGMGSTAGGIKLERIYLIAKATVREIIQRIKGERNIYTIKIDDGNGVVHAEESDIKEAFFYSQCFIILFLLGSYLLSITENAPLLSASFEFASALATTGLSASVIGPNTSSWGLIITALGMFIGRLEIFVIVKAIMGRKEI